MALRRVFTLLGVIILSVFPVNYRLISLSIKMAEYLFDMMRLCGLFRRVHDAVTSDVLCSVLYML